jgi:hypothetical protein
MSDLNALGSFDELLRKSIAEAEAERAKEMPTEAPKPVVAKVKAQEPPAKYDYFHTAWTLSGFVSRE